MRIHGVVVRLLPFHSLWGGRVHFGGDPSVEKCQMDCELSVGVKVSKVNSFPFGIAVVILLVVLFLASCNGITISDLWTVRCSEMPSGDEVLKVMQEYDDFFEEMHEEELIWEASIVKRTDCPDGAFIIIYHGGEWQKPRVLEMMDDLGARAKGDKHFFGVPFRFLSVKEDVFHSKR